MDFRPGKGDTSGLVVLILSVAVSLSLLVGVATIAIRGNTLSEQVAELLSATFGAVLGVIGVYIGQAVGRRQP